MTTNGFSSSSACRVQGGPNQRRRQAMQNLHKLARELGSQLAARNALGARE
jgi:hypothetical protein